MTLDQAVDRAFREVQFHMEHGDQYVCRIWASGLGCFVEQPSMTADEARRWLRFRRAERALEMMGIDLCVEGEYQPVSSYEPEAVREIVEETLRRVEVSR